MKSMAFSKSPSPIQTRSPSPLRKTEDLSLYASKLSSPSDSSKKITGPKQFPSEKENEQDRVASKPTKGRSPVMMPSPKGALFQKNFMAPTISASTKAVGPNCQRNRVLNERNEMVKSSHTSAQTEENVGPAVRSRVASTQLGDIAGYTELSSFYSPQIKETNSQSEHSPETKTSPWVGSETKTQPDLLPSAAFPPYDPKVNYLSPRPRFLHYKPKPRAELFRSELNLFGMDSDAESLKDSFSSECSDEAVSVQTEEEETSIVQMELPRISSRPSRVTAMHAKLTFAPLFLALLIGWICIPLSDTPMVAFDSYQGVPSVKFDGFHTRLMEVSSRLNYWWVDWFSYPFARGVSFSREISTFSLANLTCAVVENGSTSGATGVDPDVYEYEMGTTREEKEIIVSFEENEVSEMQTRYGIENVEGEEKREIEADAGSIPEQIQMEIPSPESKMKEDQQPKKFEEAELEKLKNPQPEFMEKQEPEPIMRETPESEKLNPEAKLAENQEPELTKSQEEVKESQPIMTENPEPESSNMSEQELIKISKNAARGMAAVAVLSSLVAALAFAKNKRSRALVWGSSESHVQNKMSMYQNSTVDVEFSSSSFEVGTGSGTDNSTPHERKTRRESGASSCSYGSFMSYEKISSKKANREGEEMTPVRRSNRLRSLSISS